MISDLPKELLDKKIISREQFERIEPIVKGTFASVFYELRTLLYLGVMLFTAGLGILIYKNIGELGHLVSIGALCLITVLCFWYVFQKGARFSIEKINAPTPYFDYIVLLGSLLFISVQGYIQFQYQLFDDHLEWNTLVTAAIFFFVAYRFDNLGILSLAVTAMASFFGLSVSPQKWYSSDFFETANLHLTAIFFGFALGAAAMILDYKAIKKHFTFTYINFSSLIFFGGATVGLLEGSNYGIFVLLIFLGCTFSIFYANRERSFLFLLYAFIFGYIAATYLFIEWIFDNVPELIFYYSIISCGGFVYFIVSYKKFFKRKI